MTVQTRPLVVNDFTGGFTDNFVNAPTNQAEEVVNFFIRENKSIQTRHGSHVEDPVNAQTIPAGNQRIGLLMNYDEGDKLFVESAGRIYYRDPTSYSTLVGPTGGNQAFPTATTANHVVHAEWKKHIFLTADTFESPKKMYKDDGGTYRLRTAGLPDLANAPTITPGGAGASTYLYTFHYHYTYMAGDQEFQDFGPTTTVEVTSSGVPSVPSPNAITVIPVLANSTTESWDTTVIKVFIYRTTDGGTTNYKIGEVVNGTTSFDDEFDDSAITTNLVLYTDGGISDNDPPPLSKFLTIVNNTAYYANLKEGTEFLSSDILQSVAEDPDSVPATNRIVVDDDITGIGSVQSIPLVFCRKHIFRIEGIYTEDGQGTPTAIRINDTAGCVSHRSIVQAKDFVFWAGNDKFYASDGYKVIPISDHFNDRYEAMLDQASDRENIIGAYDEVNEHIYWTVQRSAASDNDTMWVLDLRWGLKKDSAFTELSGGDSFSPSAITFLNDELVRADSRGYVFIHSLDDKTDPKVDTLLAPSAWVEQAITYNYKGFSTNFGTDAARKWVPRIHVAAVNRSNVTIGMERINDDGRTVKELTPIRYRKNLVWGDPEFTWGDPEFVWNAAGLILETRRMVSGGIRCSYMQMRIFNSNANITNSDNLGTASVSGVVATLDDSATVDWPVDSVDYTISFEADNYTRQYIITNRTADTVTFLDPTFSAPQLATQKWQLKGVKKNEILNLLSYTLLYAPVSMSQAMFEAGQAGDNA